MRKSGDVGRWRIDLLPFKAGLRRTLLEAALGCLVLTGLAAAFGISAGVNFQEFAAAALAWLWLVLWPAWRLRPVISPSLPKRLVYRLLRLICVGFLLGALWGVLRYLVWPLSLMGPRFAHTAVVIDVPVIFALIVARVAVVGVVTVGRRIRRRLRWQLITSHLAVILLTFITLTGVGSIIAANLVVHWLRPNPLGEARSIAAIMASSRAVHPSGALDPAQAQSTLDVVAGQGVVLRGAPPIAIIPKLTFLATPVEVMMVDRSGRVIASTRSLTCGPDRRPASQPALPPASIVRRLNQAALAGRAFTVTLSLGVCQTNGPGAQALVAAPIVSPGIRQPVGSIIVGAPVYNQLTPANTLAGTVAVFSVATIVLISSWLVPSLVISGAFGYIFARGLTRRIESVSRVATAIGAGDLTQRAPVGTLNEVGQLAVTVNQMAGHLETTINELRQARTQAVEALRQRQELVANISHELRTPLAIVRAHLDTLDMPAADQARDAVVEVPAATVYSLQDETERLASLVDDLFNLSRAQSGVLQVRREEVDVAAIVRDVATLMRPLAQSEGMIALTVEAPPGLPSAWADADRLRQIISNLVRNAVRHTPDGGIIVLSVVAEAGWVVISVADTGEGIPPEHLPHIFDRFYRVDQARSRSSGGAGLGLAIVREFVELMGGRVTVESKVGEGSLFRVFLPRVAPTGARAGLTAAGHGGVQ